ncbi:RRXRR domain-containing protein [Allobaculum sp. JKK-2023]|uniref:RRXRR domain-containing protein n=1 Tax=Allobaculum sp. JKK-2023 TaxID=3108943 RepID=UPI003A599976
MPTERHGKVRRLLKERKAKLVKKTPFTIQLLYDSTRYTSYCHAWSGRWFKTYWS